MGLLKMKNEPDERLSIILNALQRGEVGLNDARQNMLQRVPESGDWAVFQHRIAPIDLVWLTAKTGDRFCIFRGEELDILLHDGKDAGAYDHLLRTLLKTSNLKLTAESSPGALEPIIWNAEEGEEWTENSD